MDRFILKSTLIHGVDFQDDSLTVEFRDGGLYEYKGVSEEVFHELTVAKSVGAYFIRNIKEKYPYDKIR